MMSKQFTIFMFLIVIAANGCREAVVTVAPPIEEVFIGLPPSIPSKAGLTSTEQITHLVANAAPRTWISFFLADSGESVSVMQIPNGSAAYRESQLNVKLSPIYQLLHPELAGGPSAVDLISLPATIRSLRKTNLKPRVIILGSPLIADKETSTGITEDKIYCDGCVTAKGSPFERMANFPQGTTCTWLLPRANYGNGPNHRSQIEHFLRYTIHHKGATLLRISPSADVVFNSTNCQWDEEPEAEDDCDGLREVVPDEVETTSDAEVVVLEKNVVVRVQEPSTDTLKGKPIRVALLPDFSGSMIINPDKSDGSHRMEAVKADLIDKLTNMQCREFMVLGYAGWETLEPRLLRYPSSWFGNGWVKANDKNRAAAIHAVQAMEAGGGTPLLPALRELTKLDLLPTMVLIYGDGVPTLGGTMPEILTFVEEQLAPKDCTINTIGVGALSVQNEEFDWAGGVFFAKLAGLTQGDFFTLPDNPNRKTK